MEVISIQYLRGVAALMVVFHHLGLQLRRLGYEGYWPTTLAYGVDIFFVISGFIMWITTQRGTTPMQFYRRRIIRIVPLYWLLTTLILLVVVLFPRAMYNSRLSPIHVISSYLFIPAVHPSQSEMFPLLIPGWTLNYEIAFYAVFGLGLLMTGTRRLIVISLALCTLVALPYVITVTPLTIAAFYSSSRLLEFVYGMALGWIFVRGVLIPTSLAWTAVLAGVFLIAASETHPLPAVIGGLPALLIVGGAVMTESARGIRSVASLHVIGNASYSIYLSHTIVLAFVLVVWMKLPLEGLPAGLFAFAAIALSAVVVVGVFLYSYVEKPILRIGGLRAFRITPPTHSILRVKSPRVP